MKNNNKFLAGVCYNHRGKMQGMMSYSTSCTNNKYCIAYAKDPAKVCSHCYAHKQLAYQHGTEAKSIKNGDYVKYHLLTADEIPFINAALFRWEAFGDIETPIQAANYINVSAANPQTRFGWFTKNPFLIEIAMTVYDLEKPENLSVVVSSPYLNAVADVSKYSFVDHVFTVYTKQFAYDNNIVINCGARCCAACQKCYTVGGPFYINELLK